jgi:hypothetical protein
MVIIRLLRLPAPFRQHKPTRSIQRVQFGHDAGESEISPISVTVGLVLHHGDVELWLRFFNEPLATAFRPHLQVYLYSNQLLEFV